VVSLLKFVIKILYQNFKPWCCHCVENPLCLTPYSHNGSFAEFYLLFWRFFMKRLLLVLSAVSLLTATSTFAQFRADDRSAITSSPAPAFGISHQNDGVYTDVRGQNPPAIFTASNVLNQGTTQITITYAPAAQASWGPNPLANEAAPMIFLGARVLKSGVNPSSVTAGTVTAGEGNFDWGGNAPGGFGDQPVAALALTRSGNLFRTRPFNVREVLPNTVNKTIARMMVIVKAPGDIRRCDDPQGCQQTDNREFTFAPNLITSVRDAAEYVDGASSAPNPMSDMMLINFTLKKPTLVTARIFDAFGSEIRTILRGQTFGIGSCTIEWDGIANDGSEVTAGVYFYRLEVNGGILNGKFIVSR
jgi:hypothetical protein